MSQPRGGRDSSTLNVAGNMAVSADTCCVRCSRLI